MTASLFLATKQYSNVSGILFSKYMSSSTYMPVFFLESCNIKLISWFTIYIKSWYLEFVLTGFNCTRLILILLVCESDLEKKMRLKIIKKNISWKEDLYNYSLLFLLMTCNHKYLFWTWYTAENIEFNVYHKYGKMCRFFLQQYLCGIW